MTEEEASIDLPSTLDRLKESFLHAAARSGMEDECRSLLDLGASIAWTSPEGESALMAACQGGHYTIVSLLLELGADPCQRNPKNGRTALHYSCDKGDTLTANLLVQRMPDLIHIKDTIGKTSLDLCLAQEGMGPMESLKKLSMNNNSQRTSRQHRRPTNQQHPPPATSVTTSLPALPTISTSNNANSHIGAKSISRLPAYSPSSSSTISSSDSNLRRPTALQHRSSSSSQVGGAREDHRSRAAAASSSSSSSSSSLSRKGASRLFRAMSRAEDKDEVSKHNLYEDQHEEEENGEDGGEEEEDHPQWAQHIIHGGDNDGEEDEAIDGQGRKKGQRRRSPEEEALWKQLMECEESLGRSMQERDTLRKQVRRLKGEPDALGDLTLDEIEKLEGELKLALNRVGHRRECLFKEKVDQRLCVVCQEKEKSVLLLPCRHLCLCDGCASMDDEKPKELGTCPLCRRAIVQKIGVYS